MATPPRRLSLPYVGNQLTSRTSRSPLNRPCPKCEAPVGKRCRRWISGKIKGEDQGGGYWRDLVQVHDARKKPRGRSEADAETNQ